MGVEASGYHLPLLAPGVLPTGWEAVEFNPAHVAEQRKVNGKRGVKTDVVDATAMFDLLVAGRGSPAGVVSPAITELAAWTRYRRGRVAWRRDVEHHLVSLLDRAFPGLSGCFHRVMSTKAGRLVVTDFCDPERLARLGVVRFRRYASRRGLRVTTDKAERLVAAPARCLRPTPRSPARRSDGTWRCWPRSTVSSARSRASSSGCWRRPRITC